MNIKQVSCLHAINPLFVVIFVLFEYHVRTMHLNALRHRPKLDFFNAGIHQVFFFYRFPWRKSFLIPSRLLLYLFAILKPYVWRGSTRVGLGWFVLERSVFTGSSFPSPHTLWPPYIRHADPRHWMHHCHPLPPVVSIHSCAHILFPKTLSLQLACSFSYWSLLFEVNPIFYKWHF